jgi:Macrocin-O-methyltransferase (TylF).
MDQVVYKELLEDAVEAAASCRDGGLILLGEPDICDALRADLQDQGASASLGLVVRCLDGQVQPPDRAALSDATVDVVVIASDREKEAMVRVLPSLLSGKPHVLLAGYRHLEFRDDEYEHLTQGLKEPSLANGYSNCRVHLFQCLRNAARLNLQGVIIEFGMFRGGTTQFLAEAARSLGMNYPVIGLDTFGGFPAAQHVFDMYSHPDLFEISLASVKARLRDYDIEIVPGDIVTTAEQASIDKAIVLAFIDTDNYSSGRAAIKAVADRVVVGGAIVLDHFTGEDRFKRTLGERFAAQELLVDDPRYFNLHGTGVFVRQNVSAAAA